MTESCGCPPEAGNAVCDLPAQNFQLPSDAEKICPECGKTGKPVQGQTIKAVLSVSLRRVQDVDVTDDQRGRAEGGDGPGIPEPAQREEQEWGAEHARDECRVGHCR